MSLIGQIEQRTRLIEIGDERGILLGAKRLGEAIALAAELHANDVYGNGPYIFHPLQVLKTVQEDMDGDHSAQVVAVLHDTLEDHPKAAARIYAFLTDEEALDLNGVTRHAYGQETYKEFIIRASLRYRSAQVKLADLQRNAAPKAHRTEKHINAALTRYIPAMAVITKALLAFEKADPQGVPDSSGW